MHGFADTLAFQYSCARNWRSIACGGAGRRTRNPRGHGARSTVVATRMDHRLQMFDEPSAQLPLWSDRDSIDGWAFRESRRARRLTVRVFHSGRVEVVVPSRTSSAAVGRFLERHRLWIEKKRAEARKTAVPP